jgi:hypothetical protein
LPSLWLWHTHLPSCPVARLPLARSSHGYGHAARHLLVVELLRSSAPPASFWSVIRTLFCSISPCRVSGFGIKSVVAGWERWLHSMNGVW